MANWPYVFGSVEQNHFPRWCVCKGEKGDETKMLLEVHQTPPPNVSTTSQYQTSETTDIWNDTVDPNCRRYCKWPCMQSKHKRV
jgi:hypothetical protein